MLRPRVLYGLAQSGEWSESVTLFEQTTPGQQRSQLESIAGGWESEFMQGSLESAASFGTTALNRVLAR
jgi:hypothetical protein